MFRLISFGDSGQIGSVSKSSEMKTFVVPFVRAIREDLSDFRAQVSARDSSRLLRVDRICAEIGYPVINRQSRSNRDGSLCLRSFYAETRTHDHSLGNRTGTN